ncbi:MAG: hypothetical protein JJ899_15220 [Alphaproteobacteria bacterium]|nr:hypothetical protein [Alphaproteobacteria bacterium]
MLVALGLAGCAAPAASLLTPAVSGAPVVADFVGGNVSDSYWGARRADVVSAARKAAQAYDLDLVRDAFNDERALLVYADRSEQEVLRLRIEARTSVLTYVRINADPGLARLISRQLVEELRAADAFQVKWRGEPGAFSR